jgi:hypothetical protein
LALPLVSIAAAADADAGLREEAVGRHRLDDARQLHAADLVSPGPAPSMPDSKYACAAAWLACGSCTSLAVEQGSSVSARR